jgi:aspartyl protease family protein
MATGFMMRHSIALGALLVGLQAAAADIALIGTFADKAAILSIDAGAPKTVRVGQSHGGVTLIAVERDRATIEVDGKRRVLVQGQTYSSGASATAQSVTLSAGPGGHFMADAQVNGAAMRFMVDTGATAIAIPAAEANRLRIDYRKGQRGIAKTAAGTTDVYLVRLDNIRVGVIELQNVEAVVIEQGLDIGLLGNTFLNRMEIQQDGRTMTLKRRY